MGATNPTSCHRALARRTAPRRGRAIMFCRKRLPVLYVASTIVTWQVRPADQRQQKLKALVFVAGLAPDSGEGAPSLGDRFPHGTVACALAPPIPRADGAEDLYIRQEKYWAQFAADVPESAAREMTATQRPIAKAALGEPSSAPAGRTAPGRRTRATPLRCRNRVGRRPYAEPVPGGEPRLGHRMVRSVAAAFAHNGQESLRFLLALEHMRGNVAF